MKHHHMVKSKKSTKSLHPSVQYGYKRGSGNGAKTKLLYFIYVYSQHVKLSTYKNNQCYILYDGDNK